MLEATNISKAYATAGGVIRVIENISLKLERGDAVSIMGPSGSGKSTLLYVLGVLDSPTSGSLSVDGQDPFSMNEKQQAAFRNKNVGFLFQDHCLLPQCSVFENVLTPTLVDGRPGDALVSRARKLLEQVGLSQRLDHKPAQLSGGEKQRVALARALIREPLLLLCDEPTGNLDHQASEAVAGLLLQLHAQQKTILIVVTHNPELAGRFTTRLEMRDRQLHSR